MRALVTGAARGLGLAIARRLHSEGARVALLDRDELVHSSAGAMADASGAFAVVADLADESAVTAAFEHATAKLAGLDVLVNCAGIGGPTTPVATTGAAALRAVLEVNLVSAYVLSGRATALMVEQGLGGAIVNIGSMRGLRAEENGAPYCVSKAALGMLTQVHALEGARHGIRVNLVAPGNMATDMHHQHVREIAEERGTSFETVLDEVRRSVPLARHGTGEDVADAVAWLVSARASYVTGQTIVVDGGVLLR